MSPSVAIPERHAVGAVLRAGAPDLSVAFHEIRPAQFASALRDRSVDLVLARTFAGAADVESASLPPTPVELVAPVGHRLAVDRPVRLAELDGARLMIWSRPGTPYSDLMLNRVAAAGATVEPVESRITGGGGAPELEAEDAVAIVPLGAFQGSDAVRVEILDDFTLPLLILWPVGPPHAAVLRVREGLAARAKG